MTVPAIKNLTDPADLPILSMKKRYMGVGQVLESFKGTGREVHSTVQTTIVMMIFCALGLC